MYEREREMGEGKKKKWRQQNRKREIYKEREKQDRKEQINQKREKSDKNAEREKRNREIEDSEREEAKQRVEATPPPAAVLLSPVHDAGQWVGPGTRVCAHRPGC